MKIRRVWCRFDNSTPSTFSRASAIGRYLANICIHFGSSVCIGSEVECLRLASGQNWIFLLFLESCRGVCGWCESLDGSVNLATYSGSIISRPASCALRQILTNETWKIRARSECLHALQYCEGSSCNTRDQAGATRWWVALFSVIWATTRSRWPTCNLSWICCSKHRGCLPSEPSDGSDHLCPVDPSEIYPNLSFGGSSSSNWLSLSITGPETGLTSIKLSCIGCLHCPRV